MPGWGEGQVAQKVNADGPGPVTVVLSPGGWADLESYAEARAHQHAVADALHKLISIAWPQDRLDEVRAIADGISDEALPQYIELFQAEMVRRARFAGAK